MTLDSKKKTVFIVGPKLGIVSGVSTHLESLINSSLAENYQFSHFQIGSQGHVETKIGKLVRFIGSPLTLAFKIIKQKPDIIHINTSLDAKAFWRDFIYLAVSKIFRRRVVYQIHGGAFPDQFFGNNKKYNGFLRRVLMAPDAVVLLSEIERKKYEKFAKVKFLKVIPNGIDLSLYNCSVDKESGEKGGIMVYLGSLLKSKGLFEAIEAINSLRERNILNGFEFLIAGTGKDEMALKGRVYNLELQDVIKFVGPVFGEEKIKFWNDADLFILPSYTEGLPYAILESIASGTPVITTRVGGIPDVITDSVHGIFVKERDPVSLERAIENLISDPKRLQKLSKNCLDRAREAYSMERMVGQIRKVYEQITTV